MTISPSSQSIKKRYHEIEQRLIDFMSSSTAIDDEALFTSFALEIFQFQYDHNTPYRLWCQHLGIDQPESVTSWQKIPAVPTSSFKDSGLELNCFPRDLLNTIFKTSGTTSDQQRRGEHGFYSTALYQHSIVSAWKQLHLPDTLPSLYLTQSPTDAPESSLSHMMGILSKTSLSATSEPFFISAEGQLDNSRFIKICQSLDQPVFILGTALAFLNIIENSDSDTLPLPPGSYLFETGGFKGSGRQLDKSELYKRLNHAFKVPLTQIINEYSMTELSSQFYTQGLDQPHAGPHWTRIQVIDPETRQAAASGQTGHLQILDLANLGSVASIRTEDLTIATETHDSFQLIGRDPSALPRGCSRSADEIINQ